MNVRSDTASAAAIGGSMGKNGTVTINRLGDVTVELIRNDHDQEVSGAAIGAGQQGVGIVNIVGGKVTVNVHLDGNIFSGAAIGAGKGGTGYVNTNYAWDESKPTITAENNGYQMNFCDALIGCGQEGYADININDSFVNANVTETDIDNGAAIGAGKNGHAKVTINGGNIIAEGLPGINAGSGDNTGIYLGWDSFDDVIRVENCIGNVTLMKTFKNLSNDKFILAGEVEDYRRYLCLHIYLYSC